MRKFTILLMVLSWVSAAWSQSHDLIVTDIEGAEHKFDATRVRVLLCEPEDECVELGAPSPTICETAGKTTLFTITFDNPALTVILAAPTSDVPRLSDGSYHLPHGSYIKGEPSFLTEGARVLSRYSLDGDGSSYAVIAEVGQGMDTDGDTAVKISFYDSYNNVKRYFYSGFMVFK